MTERDFALQVARTLQQAGHIAYWAGGCVRDELLGLTPDDYDVATDAVPERVQSLFSRSLAIGASFGVIEVIGPKIEGTWRTVQVATFRSDGTYSDGRRPDTVRFGTAQEDAQRRDFTINGLFFDPVAEELHDFVGGQADLRAGILRAIGDPMARFTEDRLRILRAVRMAARFSLKIETETQAAAKNLAVKISSVSAERIADELRKLLAHPNRAHGVHLLAEFGLLACLLPEVQMMPLPEVIQHLEPDSSFILAMAALLNHCSEREIRQVANRLKLSNEEAESICWLVSTRGKLGTALPRSVLYPILAHPRSGELLGLERAIRISRNQPFEDVEALRTFLAAATSEELNPPPLATGTDLIQAGLPPGPAFRVILEQVRAAQLDQRIHTHEEAMELALSLAASRSNASEKSIK